MSQPILQLNNSSLWGQIYSASFETSGYVNQRPIPIRPIIIPFSFDRHVLAFFCQSNDQNAGKWQRGCKVSQLVQVGTNISGQTLLTTETKIISQANPTLLRWQQYSSEYFLRIDFYPWFSHLFIDIREYRGIDTDTNTQALLSIESSVNQLIQNQP